MPIVAAAVNAGVRPASVEDGMPAATFSQCTTTCAGPPTVKRSSRSGQPQFRGVRRSGPSKAGVGGQRCRA